VRRPRPEAQRPRNRRRIAAAALCLFLAAAPLLAADPSAQFRADLDYYRRTARAKSLNANDRLFILHRLRLKYADLPVDRAELEQEISLHEGSRTRPTAPNIPSRPASASENGTKSLPASRKGTKSPRAVPLVTDLAVTDDGGRVTVFLKLTEPLVPDASRVDDPARPGRPVLRVDLPGAQLRLPEELLRLTYPGGPVASVRTEALPTGAVRVSIELRGERDFRVVRGSKQVRVEVGDTPAAAAPLSAPAPSARAVPRDASAARPPFSGKVPKAPPLGPGDLVALDVSPATELSQEGVVQPDGLLSVPLVGSFAVQGMSPEELESTLGQMVKPYRMKVRRLAVSQGNVFVAGRVVRPGPVPHTPGLRPRDAIARAAGVAPDGDARSIRVHTRRGGQTKSVLVDLEDPVGQGDFALEPGDILEVSAEGNDVSVLGEVAKPGHYPYSRNLTILELVSQAGGLTPGARTSRVKVFRQVAGQRDVVEIHLGRVMQGRSDEDLPLRAGDIVLVPSRPFHAGTATVNSLTPWLYLATLLAAVAIAL
jgi:polysaccharide export outer membrane protein